MTQTLAYHRQEIGLQEKEETLIEIITIIEKNWQHRTTRATETNWARWLAIRLGRSIRWKMIDKRSDMQKKNIKSKSIEAPYVLQSYFLVERTWRSPTLSSLIWMQSPTSLSCNFLILVGGGRFWIQNCRYPRAIASLSCCLKIAGAGRAKFIPFTRVLLAHKWM